MIRNLASFLRAIFHRPRRLPNRCSCHPHDLELGFYATGCWVHDKEAIF